MFDLKTIASAYGGRVSPNGDTAQIPAPGHSKRDRSVSLRRTSDGKLLIHCFSDTDWRDVRSELLSRGFVREEDFPRRAPKTPGRSRRRSAPKFARAKSTKAVTLERAKHLWTERLPIKGSLAELYLKSRGLHALIQSAELGFYPSAQISADGAALRTAPSLLARILDERGAFMGVQLTILAKASGQKRFRLIFGRQRGGAIRLGRPEQGSLLVAEGLETAASAGQLFGLPAWALLNSQNLAAFDPPPEASQLIIAVDHDQPGLEAADGLLNRLDGISLQTRQIVPFHEGEDWNDIHRRCASPANTFEET